MSWIKLGGHECFKASIRQEVQNHLSRTACQINMKYIKMCLVAYYTVILPPPLGSLLKEAESPLHAVISFQFELDFRLQFN